MYEVLVVIDVAYNKGNLKLLVKNLEAFPKVAKKATSRAINKAATSTRAFMVKKVRTEYAVKARDVRNELKIEKANWSHLSGGVYGSGSPGIPLFSFVRGSKKTPSTRRLKSGAYRPTKGIPVLIKKSRGKLAAKGVFLAKMKSGHVGAFKRNRPSGRAISEKYGPSPLKILDSKQYRSDIETEAQILLEKNMFREADYALKQAGFK